MTEDHGRGQASLGRLGTIALSIVLCVAAVVALTRSSSEPAPLGPVTSGAPATDSSTVLPPGHPPIKAKSPHLGAPKVPMPPRVGPSVSWTAPARWQSVPHVSTMRIATYDIPHAPGDAENPELSVTRAGGDLDANADRWIAQFDPAGQKTAKRTLRTVMGLRAMQVEVKGAYRGMEMEEAEPGYMLLGVMVETAGGSHFFKLVGLEKSVEAARTELEAMLASLRPRVADAGPAAWGDAGP